MPDAKISALAELTTPDDDDELAIVDKSDLTQAASGTTKRITVANLVPALTYPTFAWNQYVTPITVAAADSAALPLDTSSDAVIINPEAWTITAGKLILPNGVYAVTWYWEQETGGLFFDNYIEVGGVVVGAIYPTAPMAHPASSWGACSTTVKLVAGEPDNYLWFFRSNVDISDHNILNLLTVIRLDA